jgi:hypothetical protein
MQLYAAEAIDSNRVDSFDRAMEAWMGGIRVDPSGGIERSRLAPGQASIPRREIIKVGVAVVEEGRLLVVRKKGTPSRTLQPI